MEKPWQDVEKVRQLCSRGPSRLDVLNRVANRAPPCLLRPRWAAFLTILRAVLMPFLIS